jgi:hypothetical protein
LNPYQKSGFIERRLHFFLEGKVLSRANNLVFVSNETLEMYINQYGEWLRKKSHVLPHITCTINNVPNKKTNQSLSFLYAGDFYGPRTPMPLFMALQLLHEESPELLSKLKFKLLGKMPEKYSELFRNSNLNKVVEICNSVPYLSSLEEMSQVDVLLLIDAPSKEGSVFFPSKLADYLAFGKPIFAITPKNGASARLVLDVGGVVAEPEMIQEVKACIVHLANNLDSSNQFLPSAFNRAKYSQNVVAEQFSKILMGI